MAPVGPITDPGRREHRLDLALWSIVALSIASTVMLSFVEPPGAGLGHGIDKVQHALAYFVTMLVALLAAVWRPGRGPGRFPDARWSIAAGPRPVQRALGDVPILARRTPLPGL